MLGLGKIAGGLGKVGGLLKPVAPILGTALGGPAGSIVSGMAMKAIGRVLGVDPADQDAVEAGLASLTPEQLAQLKSEEKRIDAELRKAGIDLRKAQIEDVQDARQAAAGRKRNGTMIFVAVASVGGFLTASGLILWLMLMHIKTDISSTENSLIFALIGYLAGMAQQVCSFYFGSSQSGEDAAERNSH